MFPHHLLLALCVVGFACIACCGGTSYAQTPSTPQSTPVSPTAADLVAQYATADDSTRAEILEQLKGVDLTSIAPMLKLMSPTLKLEPSTRWRAVEVLHRRYTVGNVKQQDAIRSSSVQGKLQQCAQEVCGYWQLKGADGVDSLLAAVESPIDPLSQQALLVLHKLKELSPAALERLQKQLTKNPRSIELAMLLANHGCAQGVDCLLASAESPDSSVSYQAFRKLRNIKELSPESLDRLQKQLSQQPHSMDLALLLGQHGRVPAEAVPGLLAALQTRSTGGCMYCAPSTQRDESSNAKMALSKIDPSAAAAVPHLIEALKIENVEVRVTVAEALGKIGPAAKEAIPALIAARDCQVKRPVPQNRVGLFGFGSLEPRTYAIPVEASWALARIQVTEQKKEKLPVVETDPEQLTKTLPGAWKIEITIAPKLLQRPIQEIREYLYLIVAVQGGFQVRECQAKIGANGLALIQLPKISDTEKKPEPEELPVNWKVSKNKDGVATLVVSHAGVGDLLFRGTLRPLDADTVECHIMASLPGGKPEEPSLPILIAKLQRVKP